MTTKIIYQSLIHRFQEPPTSQRKCQDVFVINDDEWTNIYTLPFVCSREIKAQMFQYKINMNCLMTNSRLFKMNIVRDNLCSICMNYEETMTHLFLECNNTKHICIHFQKWWKEIIGNEIILNHKPIVPGLIHIMQIYC